MMLDRDIVAVSPASTYRVLRNAGLLQRWNGKASCKGTGFVQPLEPHEHWHVDISYVNIASTFFYLCSVLEGCSRGVLHWQLRHAMTEAEVEIVIQAAIEKYPGVKARVITDNGPQFIARDFKEFIRIAGLTQVKTSHTTLNPMVKSNAGTRRSKPTACALVARCQSKMLGA